MRPDRLVHRGQAELADCGAAALAVSIEHLGRRLTLEQVREVTGSGRDGTTALRLIEAARTFGVDARGVRADLDDLRILGRGALLFWDLSHFVVLDRVGRSGVRILDPTSGFRWVSWEEASSSYTGIAILLERGEGFERTTERGPSRVRAYLRPVFAERATLASVIGTSLLLRAVGLVMPLVTAVVVDRVVPFSDRSLLTVVASCLGVFLAFGFFSTWVRSRLLLDLRTKVDQVTTLRFLEHLVALPYTFHLRRSAGDLMMRLRSNATVREVFTTGTISAFLDGSFAILYLVILLAVSPTVALIAVGVGAAQVGTLLLARRGAQRLTTASLQAEARSQSYAMQIMSGMGTLKASGTEKRAVDRFAVVFSEELAVSVDRGRFVAVLESGMSLVRSAAPLTLLVVAAVQVLDGRMTLGAALAVNALAAGFIQPLDSLITHGQSALFLRSYLERLSDVFDSPREQAGLEVRPAPLLRGGVTADRVSFRYDPVSADVIHDVSIDIAPGSSVAIVGRSGSGKTTLAHVLVGLFPATGGRVLYDGVPLDELDVTSVRRQLGVVTQDPFLFATSIRENIAFAAPELSLEEVAEAARKAGVHDDVMAMPMGYETVVGEGGALLSGGQRQRVAIARALAVKPRIVLLDEATSHLDALTERQVYEALDALECTRIVVAHRLSTVVDASKIIVLDAGRVVEVGTHAELLAQRGAYWSLVMRQLPDDGLPPTEGQVLVGGQLEPALNGARRAPGARRSRWPSWTRGGRG